MKIFVTGGTGLIGSNFIKRYPQYNYTVLTRSERKARKTLGESVELLGSLDRVEHLNDYDAVINLAGEPIVGKRWSEEQKKIICNSRWQTTQKLVDLIHASSNPPDVFLSGSAVGIYGDRGNEKISEDAIISANDFPSMLCEKWEAIALSAEPKTRVVLCRTGIVLDKNAGALEKMLLPFKMCLGGPFGDGKQYMPWIHINDMVRGIEFLLTHNQCKLAYNMAAPEPVTNNEFTRSLAQTLNRVAIFFIPELALKVMLGEASKLLLDSQRAVPIKLEGDNFHFDHAQLKTALAEILG